MPNLFQRAVLRIATKMIRMTGPTMVDIIATEQISSGQSTTLTVQSWQGSHHFRTYASHAKRILESGRYCAAVLEAHEMAQAVSEGKDMEG